MSGLVFHVTNTIHAANTVHAGDNQHGAGSQHGAGRVRSMERTRGMERTRSMERTMERAMDMEQESPTYTPPTCLAAQRVNPLPLHHLSPLNHQNHRGTAGNGLSGGYTRKCVSPCTSNRRKPGTEFWWECLVSRRTPCRSAPPTVDAMQAAMRRQAARRIPCS